MSGGSYRPLGGYSPSLQPSLDPADIADNDQLNLDGDGRQSTQSRPGSPDPQAKDRKDYQTQYATDYNAYRYGGGYGNPPEDVEAEGLIKEQQQPQQRYRTYKRRWFGLAVLTLQSFAIGWGFTAPGVVAKTALEWYGISFEKLNELGIIGNLVFLAPAPFVIWVLNRAGPKWGIVISCVFTVIGNWVIYAGAAKHDFNVNLAGTVIHSLAAPFAICAPTRYSRQWFGDRSRTLATAITSLAYPMGCGFGALTGPYMVEPIGPLTYAQQALIVAIVFTAVAIPAPFLPAKPPTPPSVVASTKQLSAKESILSLLRNKPFYLQFITFTILAGAIETELQLTIQATMPYGYSQQQGAIAVALLIFVGIGAALIVSPILDRTKQHENALKVFVTIIAICYTGLPWVPDSHSPAALYVVYAIIGAFSLSLEPAVLELQSSTTHPVSPEFSSVVCWCGCKAASALFTYLVGVALVIDEPEEGQPVGSLFNGLLLIAGLAWVTVGCTFLNNRFWFKRPEASKVTGNI